MKTCSKCGVEKPLESFGKDKQKKDGYRGVCKTCRSESVKESGRKWHHNHREKANKASAAYYAKHKERLNAKKRIENLTEERAVKIREADRQRYIKDRKNPEKVKAQRAAQLRHYYKNKEMYRAGWAKYKASKLDRTPAWLTEDHLFMIKEVYELRAMRSEMTGVEHHVDHIIPMQGDKASGLHVPWNLQVIPAKENLSKSNKLEEMA